MAAGQGHRIKEFLGAVAEIIIETCLTAIRDFAMWCEPLEHSVWGIVWGCNGIPTLGLLLCVLVDLRLAHGVYSTLHKVHPLHAHGSQQARLAQAGPGHGVKEFLGAVAEIIIETCLTAIRDFAKWCERSRQLMHCMH